jgi:PAS domain S-box-containing protein
LFKRLDLILVVVCLLVTFGIYAEGARMNRAAAKAEFARITEDGLQALDRRMNIYLQSLNGAAGMMQSSENIEYDDFETFVESLDFENYLPGINGIGFVEPVAKVDEDAFVADMRANGTPGFEIRPETNHDQKYVIKYIAPVLPNKEAVGLDISFEKGRREAADRARETNTPQLTPRILLVQDAMKEPGFLLLRPLFYASGPREGTFRGWVYAPFIGRNLLQDLTPNQNNVYDFHVYDGDTTDPEALIYASQDHEHAAGKYSVAYATEFFGRTWTVQYESTPLFEALFPGGTPLLALIAGIALTAMLIVVLRAIRQRGDSLAEVAALREQQISAREEENRSIIENSVVGIFILDERREILFANHAALEIFDKREDGMGGLPLKKFVKEAGWLPAEAGYNATGTKHDGSTLHLDLHYNEWETLNGVKRITAIVRDVSVEVGAVGELAGIKERYDHALAGSEIGVFEIDLMSGKSVVSPTWRKIMEVGPEVEDTQEEFLSRIHPDDLPRLIEADQHCITGKAERSRTEYRMQFGESWRWMRSDAVVVDRADDGSAIRMVGTQSDITALRHARNALEASEKRFRTVLDAAPVGMATLNSNGQFTSVNNAMCELTGYSQKVMTDRFNLAQIIPEEDVKLMRDIVTKFTESGSNEVYRGEHPILHKDGGQRWGLFNITWTFDKNEGAYVFIAQVNDITDQKKIDEIKNEFVSTVSHELRTPLTSIKGALGLIEMSARDTMPASALRLIEIARNNADRLTTIVNDILDLEKISSGKIEFDLSPMSLNEVISSAVQEMMPFAVTHNTKLVMDLPDTDINVTADWSRMMQVLANLTSNACKYSTEGTDVTIKAETIGDMAIVYVQNFGPGVPENFKNRIFQAFSQADGSDTRAKGGTGLGLNITRQIVWRQGGNIGFESKPSGTTVFWFTCPLATDAEGYDVLPDARTFEVIDGTRNNLRVLHLEDDEEFAEVLREGLRPFADVHNVTRLNEVHEALSAGPLDVIILDWTVPDGDAAAVLDDIAELQPTARVVGLTSDAAREKDSRVGTHLVKSQTDLNHIIESIVGPTQRAS